MSVQSIYKAKTQAGFSIIEVLITIFIIGVTLVMFQMVSNSVMLNKYNKYKEVALRVAEDQIQDLRTTAYASLPSSGSFNNSLLSTIPQGAGSMTLTQIDTGLTQATVTVSWVNPEPSGAQQVVLSTYLWQYGLGK